MAFVDVVISIKRVSTVNVATPLTFAGVVNSIVGVPTLQPVCVVAVTSGSVSLILPFAGMAPTVLNLMVAVETVPGVAVAATKSLPVPLANVTKVPKQYCLLPEPSWYLPAAHATQAICAAWSWYSP